MFWHFGNRVREIWLFFLNPNADLHWIEGWEESDVDFSVAFSEIYECSLGIFLSEYNMGNCFDNFLRYSIWKKSGCMITYNDYSFLKKKIFFFLGSCYRLNCVSSTPPKFIFRVVASRTSGIDCTGKRGLERGNYSEVKSLGWALIWLVRRGEEDTDTHSPCEDSGRHWRVCAKDRDQLWLHCDLRLPE